MSDEHVAKHEGRSESTAEYNGTVLQREKRARVLHEVLKTAGVGFESISAGYPMTTSELGPLMLAVEAVGEMAAELMTTAQIEAAYGYWRDREQDEDSLQYKLKEARTEVRDLRSLYSSSQEQVARYSKRIDELAAERDRLKQIVDGRAAIAEAEPAFERVEQALEQPA